VIHRLLNHIRGNVVGYIALMVAVVSGGGGYAVAATTHQGTTKKSKQTAIVACASKKSGELFLHTRGKCAKGRHKVSWAAKGPRGKTGKTGPAGAAGPAGAPSPSVHGIFDAQSGVGFPGAEGATVTPTALGVYSVTITDPTCSKAANTPVVTPFDSYESGGPVAPPGAVPVAWLSDAGSETQFVVHTGFIASGAFTAEGVRFALQDTCTP
jgi:hypothetical protein